MKAPQLPKLCSKFLNQRLSQASASPQTLRAYRVDLSQAFNLEAIGSWKTASTGRLSFETEVDFPLPNSDELLRMGRQALTKWSKLAPASRNRKGACLKSFMKWLYQEGHIDKDLSHQITLTKVPKKLPHYISIDEAIALLERLDLALTRSKTPEERSEVLRDQALILLLYGGGLRLSEACSAKWRSINLNQKTLIVRGKGNKERMIALPGQVITVLQKLERKNDFIWGKKELHPSEAYQIVKKWGQKAGLLKPLHPHALRHSYATHMLSSGANLRTLQSLLGHATLQATEKYLHLGVDELARTMEKFHPLAKKV